MVISVLLGLVEPTYASDIDTFHLLLEKAAKNQYDSKDSAFYYISQAKDISAKLGGRKLQGKVANREGAIHYIAGNYQIALDKFVEAENIFQKDKNSPDYIFALNGRGLIYLGQKQYKDAIEMWETTLQLNQKINDSTALSKNHFNLGIANTELKNFDLALKNLKMGLGYLKPDTTNQLWFMIKNRLAKTYFDLDDILMAEKYYKEVLSDSAKLNNWEKTFAYTGLAEVKQRQGKYDRALSLAHQGYESGLLVGAFWDLDRVTNALANIYEAKGDYDRALTFNKLHKSYSDSLYSESKDFQIAALELKLAKSDNENLRAEKEIMDDMAVRKNFILSLLIMVLLGFVFIAFIYRKSLNHKEAFNKELKKKNKAIQKQKKEISQKNKTLNQLNEAKTRIFSVLTHDLRSPINSIKQLLELQKEGMFTQEETDQALDLLYEQIVKTDEMMAKLLHWANQQIEGAVVRPQRFSLSKEVEEVIDLYEFQAQAKKINVYHEIIEDVEVIFDKGDLRIILQNLLNNSIKFTPVEGEVRFSYSCNSAGEIMLHVKDSGVGMDQDQINFLKGSDLKMMDSVMGTEKEKGTGLGLLLVKQFVINNGANLEILSKEGEGTEFILSFPQEVAELQT
ncbi:tetratricopeptide repeat protein [Litoribacter populi]|uniref:tetratricopeptide repeat protein n=1 Tax=Litoribacter populi TaxID=2598460 RepID=UPI00163DBFE1|nr:tetratricopeptide repeat protein [Litoribacter populi]